MAHFYHDLRFERTYGLPKGREHIATASLEHKYRVEKVIDKGDLTLGGLNEGVFLVKHLQANKLRVLKRIPATSRILEREVLFLQVLKHPHIVGYYDAFITSNIPRKIGLYLEYCDGGTIKDLINKYTERNNQEIHNLPAYVPEAFAWHVIHCLASALQYIHHGIRSSDHRAPPVPMSTTDWPIILHRDIKPDNIFLHYVPGPQGQALLYPHWPFNGEDPAASMTTYPKIVLADFGCATQYEEPDFPDVEQLVGTYDWMPPELPEATARGDVWTTGAVILSLCRLLPLGPVGQRPPPTGYPSRDDWLKSAKARKGIRDIGPGRSYTEELNWVLKSCLRYNKFNRPLSYELMVHVRRAEEGTVGSGKVPIIPLPNWTRR